ncbi:hypothetical protein Tco_0897324 [Tanacetum coccineum]
MSRFRLKDQLQGKDELIRKLKAQIGNLKEVSADSNLSTLEFQALETENTQLKEVLNAVRIKNDSLKDENVSIKKPVPSSFLTHTVRTHMLILHIKAFDLSSLGICTDALHQDS